MAQSWFLFVAFYYDVFFISAVPDEILKDLLMNMREKIQSYKRSLTKDQKSFYESVLKENIGLSQSIKKQWSIIQEWTIQKLYYLDILPIFFRQGLTFLKNCDCKFIQFTKRAIKCLVGFSQNDFMRLLKIYTDSHQFLRQIKYGCIQQLVNIYDLFILRNRMFFCIAKAGKNRIAQTEYAQNNPFYPKKNLQEDNLNAQNAQYINFCQIAFWSTQRDIQKQTYERKIEIVQKMSKKNISDNLPNIKTFTKLWRNQQLQS